MQQTKEAASSEYELKLEEAQKDLKLRPVVWNKGRTIGAVPLSKLANRIGFDDIDEKDGDNVLKKA